MFCCRLCEYLLDEAFTACVLNHLVTWYVPVQDVTVPKSLSLYARLPTLYSMSPTQVNL